MLWALIIFTLLSWLSKRSAKYRKLKYYVKGKRREEREERRERRESERGTGEGEGGTEGGSHQGTPGEDGYVPAKSAAGDSLVGGNEGS